MEVENNRTSSKRARQCAKLGGGDVDDELEADAAETTARNSGPLVRPWHHPSSRIFRVSRASGGKDRHSKVYTSKGLRDRRVRLSVPTAIQFYDLQDRLGYDQPSKAVEWLIKAAASAIAELPSLDSSAFAPDVVERRRQPPTTKRELAIAAAAAAAADHDANQNSSTSETSKGSVLSLSRSKEKDSAGATVAVAAAAVQNNLNPSLNSQNSFTDLLTGGGGGGIQKQQHIVTSTADYFGTDSGLFEHHHHHQQQQRSSTTATFASHFGNMVQFGNAGGEHHHHPGEMQQFGFLQQQEEHFFPVHASAASGGGDQYNLNFGLANFHRGTLQSNSLHHHQQHNHNHHQHQVHPALQRLSPLDGSSSAVHFLFGGGGAAAAAGEGQYSAGFDGHLQLCDGYKHLELKGKGKG